MDISGNKNKVVRYRIRVKKKLIQYKGGKCQRCGYDKDCPPAYDFHHRDPKEKSFQISGQSIGFERLKKEADKCDLLCRNCHAEVHDELWTVKRQELLNSSRIKVKGITYSCKYCNCNFQPKRKNQKFCSYNCSHKNTRKCPNKPSFQEIQTMLQTMTWADIGIKYGVSHNAVRKWYKSGK